MKKYLFLATLFISLGVFAQSFYGGQTIYKNKRYYSPSKQYYLLFQNDGNLVMYNRSNASVWDSKTLNTGNRAEFQSDGNFVIYDGSDRAVFSTNTQNRGASLNVQDDGNLVVYNKSNSPVWSSVANKINNGGSWNVDNSAVGKGYKFGKNIKIHSPNGEYHLVFQDDGNLVVYDRNKSVYWDSKTANTGVRAEFQNDGNLVVYDRRNQAVFSSKTMNLGGKTLKIQDDGNLVIYGTRDNPLWASDDNK